MPVSVSLLISGPLIIRTICNPNKSYNEEYVGLLLKIQVHKYYLPLQYILYLWTTSFRMESSKTLTLTQELFRSLPSLVCSLKALIKYCVSNRAYQTCLYKMQDETITYIRVLSKNDFIHFSYTIKYFSMSTFS